MTLLRGRVRATEIAREIALRGDGDPTIIEADVDRPVLGLDALLVGYSDLSRSMRVLANLLQNAPFFPVSIFLGSILGCCYVLFHMVLVAIASRWPTVDGEIVNSYMIQQGLDARGLSERVTYRYTVDGQPFVNDRVRIGPQPQRASIVPATGYPIATSGVKGRYPVGRRVAVHYNPRRPQDSVLHAQPNLPVSVLFAAAVVGLYFGARAIFWPR